MLHNSYIGSKIHNYKIKQAKAVAWGGWGGGGEVQWDSFKMK